MAFPEVGVKAVVEGISAFERDKDKVNKGLQDMGQQADKTAGGMSKSIGGLAGALGGMLVVAGGIIAADIFRAMASGLKQFASDALDAASSLQQLEVRFTTLGARELAAVNTGMGFSDWLRESTDLSEYAVQRYENLRAKHDELVASMVGLREGSTAWKNYNNQLQWTDEQIRKLMPDFENMDTRMQQAAFGTYSFQQALKDAAGSAEQMVDWAIKLAITTPFTTETVSGAAALSMAMGYTQEQAQRLTVAVSNFTAGMGLTDEVMSRIIHNFGQMKAAGKVTGTELRDLARGGMVPVNDVLVQMQQNLGKMSMPFAKFKKAAGEGQYGVQPFVDAFLQIVERDFAGAAERLSRTWSGATANLKEFFQVIMGGQVLKPILDDVASAIANMVDLLSEPENVQAMKNTGTYLKTIADNALGTVGALLGFGDISPSEGLKAFENIFRSIAMWTVRIEALATGKTTLEDMLSRLFGEGGVPPELQAMIDFFSTAGEVLGGLADTIGGWIQTILDAFAKEAPAVKGTVMQAITDILDYFTKWYSEHEADIDKGKQGVDGFVQWLATNVVPFLTGPVLESAAAGLVGLTMALGEFVGLLLDIGAQDWEAVGPDITGIVLGILALPVEISNQILASQGGRDAFWLSRLLYGDLNLGPPPESVAAGIEAWGRVWPMLLPTFEAIATQIGLKLYGIGFEIGTALAQWASNAYTSGQNIIMGVWRGMGEKVAALKAQIETWISELIELWNELWDLRSPSHVMMGIGKGIIQGLQVGMSRQFAGAERTIQQGAAGIAAAPMAMAPASVTNNRSVNLGTVNINSGRDELWFDRQMRDWLGG